MFSSTEFGYEKKGRGEGKGQRVKWELIMKELELGGKKRQRMAKKGTVKQESKTYRDVDEKKRRRRR